MILCAAFAVPHGSKNRNILVDMFLEIPAAEYLIVYGIIFLFSVVQSVFGVGLLVFGTPALLLMGYTFDAALCCLLPSSIAISIFQVIQGWNEITIFRSYVPIFILPFVAIGFIATFYTGAANLSVLIGIVLIITALVRLFKKVNISVASLLKRNLAGGLILTGLIHGATNLGGAPLTIIASSSYSDKKSIRANVAYAYLLMALSQIVILLITQRGIFNINVSLLPVIAVATYIIFGQKLFKKSNEVIYHRLMTILIFFFGLCLLNRR